MAKKLYVDLPGSEHTGTNAVQIKLYQCPDENHNRLADLKLSSDGMEVKVFMMESDLRVLAHAILKNTRAVLDEQ